MKKFGVSGGEPSAVMLSFRERFTSSPQFLRLFREGMALVEETAEYLDGEGRKEARLLTPPSSLAFTTESMKLTTRLMQLASWLLLRRAIANGEITAQDANHHRRRARLTPQSATPAEGFDGLPETFKRLIDHSHRLHDRILRLDRLIGDGAAQEAEDASPVVHQMARIRLAFPAA